MAQNSHHSELICYLPIFNLPRLLFFIKSFKIIWSFCVFQGVKRNLLHWSSCRKKKSAKKETGQHHTCPSAQLSARQIHTWMPAEAPQHWAQTTQAASTVHCGGRAISQRQKVPVSNSHCGFCCQVLMELKVMEWFGCFHWSPSRSADSINRNRDQYRHYVLGLLNHPGWSHNILASHTGHAQVSQHCPGTYSVAQPCARPQGLPVILEMLSLRHGLDQ